LDANIIKKAKGRPKKRWLDSVQEDLKIMGVLDWKECFRQEESLELLEQAKTHPG
jgi:hypothetical protein